MIRNKILGRIVSASRWAMLLAASFLSMHAQGSTRDEVVFFHTDILGSAVAAVNEQGALCWNESYTPYGDKTIEDEGGAAPNTPTGCGILGEERGYTGHTEDFESGLVYAQQRYYEPSIGRFLSIDPFSVSSADVRTINRYSYGLNNPYKYTDPTGEGAVSGFMQYIFESAEAIGGFFGIGDGAEWEQVDEEFNRGYSENSTTFERWLNQGEDALALITLGGSALVTTAIRQAGKAGLSSISRNSALQSSQTARQIDAAWSVSKYRHGGEMTGIEHINYRHAFGSGFPNTSKFADGTTLKDISSYVDSALRHGNVTKSRNSYTVEHNVGHTIGTNSTGGAASNIRVHVRDGIIQTAFPY